ncbi:hypothetical protein [Pseudobdellovibrio exovorus]|nr:hypothetical protein [Pseudobdellovibrio exovorus]
MKLNLWSRIMLVMILGGALASCDRATSNSSTVSLQLPQYSQQGSSSHSQKSNAIAVLCNPCLKSVAISIEGSDFATLSHQAYHPNFEQNFASIETSISFEVPGGTGRVIKVLALYRHNSDDENEAEYFVHYGTVKVDLLSPEPPPIVLNLSKVGQFRQGSIQGRYMSNANGGLTGSVYGDLLHAPSGLTLNLGVVGEMVNGWFSFNASENFPITYRLAQARSPFFQNVTTETFKAEIENQIIATGSNGSPRIAHVHRPVNYYRKIYDTNENAYVFKLVKESRNLVFGYFGPAAETSGGVICKQKVAGAISVGNLVTQPAQVAPNVDYSDTANSQKIYVTGGMSQNSGCYFSNPMKLINPNQINITVDQFNAHGEEVARGLGGPFSMLYDNGVVTKFQRSGNQVYLQTVTDLFGFGLTSSYDSVRVYIKEDDDSSQNVKAAVNCHEKLLDRDGYTELLLLDSPQLFATLENNVKFTVPTGYNSSQFAFAVCPTKSGNLTGVGGLYLGKVFP